MTSGSHIEVISLISLIVEYEVPPSQIIEAIETRRLRPHLKSGTSAALETIVFDSAEVENVFVGHTLRQKSFEQRAEATRRLQRYDAIVAGIISAVIAAGILELASTATRPRRASIREAPRVPGPPFSFLGPVDFSSHHFLMLQAAHTASFMLHETETGPVDVFASAGGLALHAQIQPLEYERPCTCINHGGGWWTSYEVGDGQFERLTLPGQSVEGGAPLLRLARNESGRLQLVFGVWRQLGREGWASHLELVEWD